MLAASAVLVLFFYAYEAAVWYPGRPLVPATDPSAEVESAALVAAPANPAPTPAPAPAPAPPATPRIPPARLAALARRDHPVYERGSWFARRPRLVRRYVGTVGGQPATALLTWQNPDSVTGSFYFHHQGGPAYILEQPFPPDPTQPRPRRRGPQVLAVTAQVWDGAGEWVLRGRPGATLTATWRRQPSGRSQPVQLRESYAGAVRLAVQTEWVHGTYYVEGEYGGRHSSVAEVKYEFLHLPAPAAVPPALRPVLSPGPAARRRLLEHGDYDCRTSYEVTVRLNDYGLLGYQYREECSAISGSSDSQIHNALLDLRGGHRLRPESQLLPRYEFGLARLLARHLLRDSVYWQINRDSTWRRTIARSLSSRRDTLGAATRWLLASAPPGVGSALFTGAGLEVEDWRGYYIEALPQEKFTWFIPYAELRPLVRPGTPLARMLAARGLW